MQVWGGEVSQGEIIGENSRRPWGLRRGWPGNADEPEGLRKVVVKSGGECGDLKSVEEDVQ